MFKRKKKQEAIKACPHHVAIIMDGNGRWATQRKLPRKAGHKAGGEALRRIVKAANLMGIKHLSVYAFSTENWNRPQEEVDALMHLLIEYCTKEIPELRKNNVRLKFIGAISDMPLNTQEAISAAQEALATCEGMQLNICINYGARDEMVHAVKTLITEGYEAKDITTSVISDHLYTKGIPDPDLLIRTSGEIRLSNYYLWQLAYSEFVFIDKLWPDMQAEDLQGAIEVFQARDRRYGKVTPS